MAGIFGFVRRSRSFDPLRSTTLLTDEVKQGFDHPNNSYLNSDQTLCLGYAFPHHYGRVEWPLGITEHKRLQVFGELFLPNNEQLDSHNAHILVEALEEQGVEYLLSCDGSFLIAVADMEKKEIILYNDPFGNFAMYYADAPEAVVFATQMKAIASVLPEYKQWDEEGFAQYIGIGQTLNGRTLYQGIKKLLPGYSLKVTKNNFTLKQYFKAEYKEIASEIPHILEGTYSELRQAVAIRIPRSGALTALSGGFDTRVIWSLIDALGLNSHSKAYTHGLLDSTDIVIARKIAAQLQVDHEEFLLEDHFFATLPDLWSKTITLTEGGATIDAAVVLAAWQRLQGRYKILIDGHGGAHYRRQVSKGREKLKRSDETDSEFILKCLGSPLRISSLLNEDVRRNATTAALNGIDECLGAFGNPQLGDAIDLFYLNTISGERYAAIANAQMNYIGLSHPFLSVRAFQYALRLSMSHRTKNSIHRYIVAKSGAGLNALSLDNMGMRVPYSGFEYLRYIPMLWEKIIQVAAKSIPSVRILSVKRPPYSFAQVADVAKEKIYEELMDNSLLDNVINRDILNSRFRNSSVTMMAGELNCLISLSKLLNNL